MDQTPEQREMFLSAWKHQLDRLWDKNTMNT